MMKDQQSKTIKEIAEFYNYPIEELNNLASFYKEEIHKELDKAILIRGNFPIKAGKIKNISFVEGARDIRDNTITVHVDQEVSHNDLFDALIPYFKSINLKTGEIKILLPANFKINIAEIMKWFCSCIRLEDTTDNILDKNQPKLFIGIVRNDDVLKILFDKYERFNNKNTRTQLTNDVHK